MIITQVPREALEEFWPIAMPMLQKAIDAAPGFYRPVDILDNIIKEIETLWAVLDDDGNATACFTTLVHQYPLCKRVMVHHVGGADLDIWQDECWSILKKYAKDIGCTGIDATGRDGWRARARQRGCRIISMYSIDLEN